jgi:hypothetical protein
LPNYVSESWRFFMEIDVGFTGLTTLPAGHRKVNMQRQRLRF